MICFDRDNKRFNYRIAGVVIHNNRLLLHRTEKDSFWALPGGRNEFNEFSKDTLIREIKEEIGEEIEIERLLWVVENFFEFDNKDYHELSFCYLMKFKNDSHIVYEEEFYGIEGDKRLIFRWFDINELDSIEVYPSFIKKKVLNLSESIEHIMHIGD
jgi:ADP-ribose pyrophosphatase YjhB (NUDIX family)